ncbi:DNA replication complex GINS protein PSF3 [Toxorhynchites rutilus septentrionalis]|uniref:DNA replication complex GINS protein PSF3 n=1 Tax=Toxorhynchites rutilus septentrionalis TaxID=329112 RepID=UPI002479B93B|nr:DNA replication complex GINS protein PSF3 [Toxorhynchites rutilus septentrionalis]
MHCSSYYPNYYSIDDVMVTQERIQCLTLREVYQMGFLDSSQKLEHLEKNVQLELPLWYLLLQDERNAFVKINIPDIFTAAYKEIYKADASYVELGKLNKFYYELGMYITKFEAEDGLAEMLFDAAQKRVSAIKDMCNNVSSENLIDNKNLEHLECILYEVGSRSHKMYSDWLQEKSVNIKSTELVTNHRKRKRDILDDDESESQPSQRLST